MPPSDLREVIEAAMHVSVLETSAGRDAVLMLLRPELASSIPRMAATRTDVISIVSTCAHYGCLRELIDAIHVCDGGTTAMTQLSVVSCRFDRRGI
jgi:hypothetical protein